MDDVNSLFSDSYQEARAKFRTAAAEAGGSLHEYEHPLRGPDSEPLCLDVAQIGLKDASNVLVLIAGTHGVEGFCGSACQAGAMQTRLCATDTLPPGVQVLVIHGLNPYGFAHLRRVNEDNIDLNRNFIAFDAPLPENEGYENLADALVPNALDGAERVAADAALQRFLVKNGENAMKILQGIVQRGQYSHPEGLFFGGKEPSWSRKTLVAILRTHLQNVTKVGVLDFHTGLGPSGVASLLVVDKSDSDVYHRARSWYGEVGLISIIEPNAVSARVVGSVPDGFHDVLGSNVEMTYVGVEYGTVPLTDVFGALREEHILYAAEQAGHTVEPSRRSEIKRTLRAVFDPQEGEWRAAIWQRAEDLMTRALAALT